MFPPLVVGEVVESLDGEDDPLDLELEEGLVDGCPVVPGGVELRCLAVRSSPQ